MMLLPHWILWYKIVIYFLDLYSHVSVQLKGKIRALKALLFIKRKFFIRTFTKGFNNLFNWIKKKVGGSQFGCIFLMLVTSELSTGWTDFDYSFFIWKPVHPVWFLFDLVQFLNVVFLLKFSPWTNILKITNKAVTCLDIYSFIITMKMIIILLEISCYYHRW